MAFLDFLDHRCDLYHVIADEQSPGYGLAASPAARYPAEPDEREVQCHFAQAASGGTVNTVTQQEPYKAYEDRIKLVLPFGTDVRVNDKVIDHRTGYAYIAEIPRNIRNHHIYVYVKRDGIEAGL